MTKLFMLLKNAVYSHEKYLLIIYYVPILGYNLEAQLD